MERFKDDDADAVADDAGGDDFAHHVNICLSHVISIRIIVDSACEADSVRRLIYREQSPRSALPR